MLDSLVRVSRRAAYDHYASILANAFLGPGWRCRLGGYNTPPREKGGHVPPAFVPSPKPMLAPTREQVPRPSLIASASLSTISRTV